MASHVTGPGRDGGISGWQFIIKTAVGNKLTG